MHSGQIYFDYAATTPVEPRVMQAMQPYFQETFGNPSSAHTFGQEADAALEDARAHIARLLNAAPGEILFTSGATESNNLALRGLALAAREVRSATRLVTTPVEHDSVHKTLLDLVQQQGFELEYLQVDSTGRVVPESIQSALTDECALVSVVCANNEIGTLNPLAEIGLHCQAHGIPFHSDAAQAGHLPLNVLDMNVDLLSISGHKLYAPKGVGALFVRSGTDLHSTLTGGSQEFGLRAGTVNTAFAVALAAALEIAQLEGPQLNARWLEMRDQLIRGVLGSIPDAMLTGHPSERLPHHASFVFEGVDSNELLTALDLAGFACSSGSACKTGAPEPSRVLQALGIGPQWTSGSLRITLGRQTEPGHIQRLVKVLPDTVQRLRRVEIPQG